MNKNNVAISFEHVGKMYRLGLIGTGTLRQDLHRWWTMSVLGKEDPYLKIGEANVRSTKGKSDFVYAIHDITFDIEQGDVVGIIGKNGAGKSTLLKLLSRITAPSTGVIRARGRMASLLEVGTGFHQELTGRENIYMNGCIMGMTKREIDRRLDEIVDFAGIERYLDTPVKRYSSGMTVRLGFAVAAFLEPEILVVDEVLAVGDAEFQKKAIGKMQDVSRSGGRTVLFVSHNMDSMLNLCNHGILLENGMMKSMGNIKDTVAEYLSGGASDFEFHQQGKDKNIYVSDVCFVGTDNQRAGIFSFDETIGMELRLRKKEGFEMDSKAVLTVCIESINKTRICNYELPLKGKFTHDEMTLRLTYPAETFLPGRFSVRATIHVPNVCFYDRQDTCVFTILDNGTEFMKYGNGGNIGLVKITPQLCL